MASSKYAAAVLLAAVAAVLLIMAVEVAQGSYDDTTYYNVLPITRIGDPERVACSDFLGNVKCRGKRLTCPKQCPNRAARAGLSCFADCSPKCEATCKRRKINCQGYGAVCYDPRFVGGDGVVFYFHGKANQNFCIVSDTNIHINAHFIGKRPEGRTRDYTWVQALGIMYSSHNFTVAAKKVATWDETADQLLFSYDGKLVTVATAELSTWVSPSGDLRIERLTQVNSVEVVINKIMSLKVGVVPITQKESKVHNYQISSDDCFAHLDLQFKFMDLSATVDGVLGQTYQPNYQTPVKVGVPMPIMGGDHKYTSSSLLSSDCKASKFSPSNTASSSINSEFIKMITADCTSRGGQHGIMCRR
ncbi:hypothetical protein O6H91_15G009800 [Diphasiastrum complanatum]|uniref:Uncharacterized protein n=1 Tax=Diphasiastrum complanatum TaxID=34168 RepID=A0ACC2BFW0_DIPCM|nr:hypothetical protein O6H91_15G009800 [Diphasiastrum complanatum]